MTKDSFWWVKYFLDFSILRNLQTILKTGRHFVVISMIIKLSSELFKNSTVLKSKKDCEKVSQRLSSYRLPMHKLWRLDNNRKSGVSFVSKSKFMLIKWCCVSQTIWCKLYIFNLPHVCVCVSQGVNLKAMYFTPMLLVTDAWTSTCGAREALWWEESWSSLRSSLSS